MFGSCEKKCKFASSVKMHDLHHVSPPICPSPRLTNLGSFEGTTKWKRILCSTPQKKKISQKSPIHLRRLREHTWSHCHLHQTASGTLFTDPGSDQHQWTAAHFKSSMSLWIYMTISTGQLISLFTYSFIVLIILLFVSTQWLLLLYCYYFINSPFSYRGLLSFCRRLW